MSSISSRRESNEIIHEVVWTDTNNLGLNEQWVSELVAKGYVLIDKRTKPAIDIRILDALTG